MMYLLYEYGQLFNALLLSFAIYIKLIYFLSYYSSSGLGVVFEPTYSHWEVGLEIAVRPPSGGPARRQCVLQRVGKCETALLSAGMWRTNSQLRGLCPLPPQASHAPCTLHAHTGTPPAPSCARNLVVLVNHSDHH